jgi:hypothetical protein
LEDIEDKKMKKSQITNYKKNKGSYGLHQGPFELQAMTALNKSFCGGSRGAVFSKRVPLAAGGEKNECAGN